MADRRAVYDAAESLFASYEQEDFLSGITLSDLEGMMHRLPLLTLSPHP